MSGDDLIIIRCLEGIRWPEGVKCLRCAKDRVRRLQCKGKGGRPRHLYWCADCGYEFSITVGTLFQGSHLPLTKWFHAIHLVDTQKDISAMRLSRELSVSYESAWSVAKRIRRAMAGQEAELCKQIAIAQFHSAGNGNGNGHGNRDASAGHSVPEEETAPEVAEVDVVNES